MTIGPLLLAAGLLLYTRVQPGHSYLSSVLPGAVVFGLGLVLLVAPLTATVLASVSGEQAGVASGVNNAVARLAGLLAVAVLPAATGINSAEPGVGFGPGFVTACASPPRCAWSARPSRSPRSARSRVRPTTQPLNLSCHVPDVLEPEAA